MKHFNYSNFFISAMSGLTFILCLWVRFTLAGLANFGAVLADVISFSSFIVCLMFIGLAYLPLQSNSQIIHAMEDLQTSTLIMYQILVTITIYFLISLMSIIVLMIGKGTWLSVFLSSVWMTLFVAGVLEVSSLIYELFKLILYIAQEHKHSNNNGY